MMRYAALLALDLAAECAAIVRDYADAAVRRLDGLIEEMDGG